MTALVVLTLIGALATAFLAVSLSASRQTDQHADIAGLRSSAESAMQVGVNELWSAYLAQGGGVSKSMLDFRTFLTAQGVTTAQPLDLRNLAKLPHGGSAAQGLSGTNVELLSVTRVDGPGETELRFSTTVSSRRGDSPGRRPVRKTFEGVYVVDGAEWPGLDYALLANNVNCIMCHLQVDSVDRFYNKDPALYDSFDRIKLGTLENLLLRSSAESVFAGTLHVRGLATDDNGVAIANWAAQTVKSVVYDSAGKIQEDAWGKTTSANLVPAGTPPLPMKNLYLNYDNNQATMVDGYLPETFPAPFPDDGGYDPLTGTPTPGAAGNRVVDQAEFYAASYDFTGSLSGGAIFLANPADPVDTAAELTTALSTGTQPTLSAVTTGNVVLTGTAANPIVLNGQVAIDGDLVIQGYVVGEGSLLVSGNVYIPTDLKYLDGVGTDGVSRSYGINPGGTQNRMAIASGGSVVVGNMFYDKDGGTPVNGSTSGTFNFVLSELSIFNRNEWMKTQSLLPASGQSKTNPSTWTVSNPGYKGAGYVPRYYALAQGGAIPIFNQVGYFDGKNWVGQEHPSDWGSTLAYANLGNTSDPYLYNPDMTPKAVVQYLTADGGWMNQAMLSKMMGDAVTAHAANKPLEIDALVYSNNSIFGIVGKSTPMKGQMIVNGALLAADIGLLLPGPGSSVGLNLNFDARTKTLLKLRSDQQVKIQRRLWNTAAVAN
jgi:hypothetical protein